MRRRCNTLNIEWIEKNRDRIVKLDRHKHFGNFLHLFISLLIVLLSCTPIVLSSAVLNNTLISIERAEIPIFTEMSGEAQLSCVIYANRIFKDYQRRMFFRIGAIPLFVAEGVRFEILEPQFSEEALTQARESFLSDRDAKSMELRHVEFQFASEDNARLKVGVIHVTRNSQWKLANQIVVRIDGNQVQGDRGTLDVTGEWAGRILIESEVGIIEFNLFRSGARGPSN